MIFEYAVHTGFLLLLEQLFGPLVDQRLKIVGIFLQ